MYKSLFGGFLGLSGTVALLHTSLDALDFFIGKNFHVVGDALGTAVFNARKPIF